MTFAEYALQSVVQLMGVSTYTVKETLSVELENVELSRIYLRFKKINIRSNSFYFIPNIAVSFAISLIVLYGAYRFVEFVEAKKKY